MKDSELMIEAVNKVKKGIIDLKVVGSYVDDHLQCREVDINNVRFDFLWYDDVGFLTYYEDSKSATEDLIDAMNTCISIQKEDEEKEY